MGYYTFRKLTILDGEGKAFPDQDNELDVHKKNIYETVGYDTFDSECKWYEEEDDMRAYSKLYPDRVFEMYGEGEENGDIWYKYYKDGKLQVCPAQITFDNYNPNKLE